jgi:hypothetical protein
MFKSIFTTLIAFLLLNGTSFAATTAGRTDHSGILVWTFLGFCALIVVAQLLPALMVILGVVKSTSSASEKQHATVDAKK